MAGFDDEDAWDMDFTNGSNVIRTVQPKDVDIRISAAMQGMPHEEKAILACRKKL